MRCLQNPKHEGRVASSRVKGHKVIREDRKSAGDERGETAGVGRSGSQFSEGSAEREGVETHKATFTGGGDASRCRGFRR